MNPPPDSEAADRCFRGQGRATQLWLAAAVSVLLHLALARGLALSTVGLSTPKPAVGSARPSVKPPTRPATADYQLRSPRTRPDTRPAHERPLAMSPVVPSASPPAVSRDRAATLTPQPPREIALLERLAFGGDSPAPAPPRPAAPARSGPAAAAPTRAAAPPAGSLPATVAAPASPVPASRGVSPAAGATGPVAAPAAAESLLARMAATAATLRQPTVRAPLPPQADRASLAAAALGQSGDVLASIPSLPAAETPAIAGPAAGAMPAPRVLGPAPLAAIGPRSGRGDDSETPETLSLTDVAGTGLGGLEGARPGGRPAAGRPRPALDRAALIALPEASRAPEVADAFRRRARSDRAAAGDAAADTGRTPARRRTERLIDAGLAYLARVQEADGSWSLAGGGPEAERPRLDSDSAATGLALLSFFGAGHDHFVGPHRDTIRRGLEFLLSTQRADGDLYTPADPLTDGCAWLYSHAIATMALCEAVGMTGDPLVRPAAARACGFIASSREPRLGGWRYAPGREADLSVSGWMLVALRSGQLAGLDVDRPSLAGVVGLLDAAAGPRPEAYAYNPRFPDQRPSAASRGCMTAVGTLMRLHTRTSPDDPRVMAAARVLAASQPAYERGRRDCYLWYYAAQVLIHTGGREADAWYESLLGTLEPEQGRDGGLAGSWDPFGRLPDRWASFGGRLYVTTLHLLALETPDRFLPTFTATE